MRIFLFCLTFMTVTLGTSIYAFGQGRPQCNTREIVVGMLGEKYHEVPVAIGVANNGGLIEVLTAKDGVTFSILITSPKGMSCLVAAGEGWRDMKVEWVSPDPEA